MRVNYFFAPLVLIPLCAFSELDDITGKMNFSQKEAGKNTIVTSYSNEQEQLNSLSSTTRSVELPTHIIRLTSNMDGQQLSCDQVNEEIDKTYLSQVAANRFLYSAFIGCTYDPETHYAIEVVFNTFFDPTDDTSIDFLKDYLEKYNGSDFLGTKLKIESAKGVIVSLSLSAGIKKNPDTPPFIQYRQDRSNYYFANNYEMHKSLITDIRKNFFSDDPNIILPFLNKWLFSYASKVYKAILRDSNYVELLPERVFLMEDGDKIFVSEIKYHFGHSCTGYENQKCLKRGS